MTNEEQLLLKIEFAKWFIKLEDPHLAAQKLYPDNLPISQRMANEWSKDPFVISKMGELEEELSVLPTKKETCKSVWDRAHSEGITPDEFQKLMRLYAELNTFIEKPGTQINVDNRKQINVENISTIQDAEQAYQDLISG